MQIWRSFDVRSWLLGRGLRKSQYFTGVAAAAALLPIVAAAAQTQADLQAFLAVHRCAIVERFEIIHARGNPANSKDRFLAVTLRGQPQAYVQCLFFERDTKMSCEAASGFYAQKPEEPRRFRLAPEEVAALGRLGFSTDDSAGNFKREIEIGSPPNLGAVADLMLSALHDGYGARVKSRLKWSAPLAPRINAKFSRCTPRGA